MDRAAKFAGLGGIGYRPRAPDQGAHDAVPPTTRSTTDSTTMTDAQ